MIVDPWADHHVRIKAAVDAREGAFAAFGHSPNASTQKAVENCQYTLNWRLDQLWQSLTDQQRAEIDARPVRQAVTV
jgi:hypothetical protein